MNLSQTTIPTYRDAIIAALQMVSAPHLDDNLKQAQSLLTQAAAQGAQFVVLPEYFALMGMGDNDKIKIREPFGNGPIQAFLAQQARRLGVWLIGGSIPLAAKDPDKVFNTTLVYDPEGNCVARYDKIHLFSFEKFTEHYNEAVTIEAGTLPVSFETPFGHIGLSICYDLRFPELYRQLSAKQPLDLIVLPAAFTATTGQAHWEILLRARAIENQCYLLAAGQGGNHLNGRETYGDSMLIDPWGTIVDRKLKGNGIVLGRLDHDLLARVREAMPVYTHRVIR